MTLRRVPARWSVLPLLVLLIAPQGLLAQQDKAAAPKQPPAKPSASETALDTLTGPIALYPDALVAQVLEASKDVAAVRLDRADDGREEAVHGRGEALGAARPLSGEAAGEARGRPAPARRCR